MADRTNTTDARSGAVTAGVAGVLRPDEFARHVELARRPPDMSVERWVENHWSLRWDLPDDRPFSSQVLPHPTCSLTVERCSHPRPDLPTGETVVITGVTTQRFDVDVRGWGRVVGVRFRPGGLTALTGRPASAWTNGVVSACDVLPAALCAVLADPDLATSPDEWAAVAETGLAALAIDDSSYDLVITVIADMLADRSLLTAADVGRRHGVCRPEPCNACSSTTWAWGRSGCSLGTGSTMPCPRSMPATPER